jgi:hypothetical protein
MVDGSRRRLEGEIHESNLSSSVKAQTSNSLFRLLLFLLLLFVSLVISQPSLVLSPSRRRLHRVHEGVGITIIARKLATGLIVKDASFGLLNFLFGNASRFQDFMSLVVIQEQSVPVSPFAHPSLFKVLNRLRGFLFGSAFPAHHDGWANGDAGIVAERHGIFSNADGAESNLSFGVGCFRGSSNCSSLREHGCWKMGV